MHDSSLRDQVIALRRAGRSRREIKEALGITGNRELGELLDSEPPPEWTKRPNAKDGLRQKARELRSQGWMYDEITAELGVSKSSVSLWTRDVSTPLLQERVAQRKAEGQRRRDAAWAAWRDETVRRGSVNRQLTKFAAAQELGDLSERDLLMLGAIAYWCEGAKDKSYRREERVNFINSDAALVRLFLRFLEVAGVERERLRFRLHIRESADIGAATRYWATVVSAEGDSFQSPIIKRHRPKTNRKNISEDYRGCLQVTVLQGAALYRQIEGWAFGAMLGEVRRRGPAVVDMSTDEHRLVQRLRACTRGES